MIKYALNCDRGHDFESWFRDSDAFDVQARRGFVTCPVCQSIRVEKAIMAPAIATRRAVAEAEPAAIQAPEPLLDERETKMRALARQIRQHITETAEDVGKAFPEQARAMHEGAAEPRPIMGEATMREVRELIEDGVGIMPVPELPEDRH